MDRFAKLDIFGTSVTLTHNGQKKYKTKLGALFTIIFFVGIMAITIEGLAKIYTGQIQNISTEIRHYEESMFAGGIDLVERGFDLAFGFEKPLLPTIGELQITHRSQSYDSSGKRNRVDTRLEMHDCGSELDSWSGNKFSRNNLKFL